MAAEFAFDGSDGVLSTDRWARMAEGRRGRGEPATPKARGREDLTGFIHRVAIGSSMPTNSGTIAPVLGATKIPKNPCPEPVQKGLWEDAGVLPTGHEAWVCDWVTPKSGISEIVYLPRSSENSGAEAEHSSIDAGMLFALRPKNRRAKGSALRSALAWTKEIPRMFARRSLSPCAPRGIVKCISEGCYITAFTDHPGFETLFADENCKGKTSPAISLAISPAGRQKSG